MLMLAAQQMRPGMPINPQQMTPQMIKALQDIRMQQMMNLRQQFPPGQSS